MSFSWERAFDLIFDKAFESYKRKPFWSENYSGLCFISYFLLSFWFFSHIPTRYPRNVNLLPSNTISTGEFYCKVLWEKIYIWSKKNQKMLRRRNDKDSIVFSLCESFLLAWITPSAVNTVFIMNSEWTIILFQSLDYYWKLSWKSKDISNFFLTLKRIQNHANWKK